MKKELLLVVALGCGNTGSSPGGEPAPAPAPTVATSEEPAPPSSSTGADEPSNAPVNLLATVASQVVVSSAASAGMSGPSRMLDGRIDTAWNSASGDLVGAWILISLPPDAEVTEIRLVPGFVRNYQGRDLWAANHRIERVRVSREGTEIATHDFDIARPELQAIPAAGAGGLWRIEVLEVEPGTTREWTEACVTELEVWGRPGPTASAGTAAARIRTLAGSGGAPRVAIDGLSRRRPRTWPEYDQAYGAIATGLAGDIAHDDEIALLLQGAHLARIRPQRAVELSSAAGGDRVVLALYYYSEADEAAVAERMARTRPVRRRRDEPCEGNSEESVCPTLALARVSIPADGPAVVDAVHDVGSDVCSVESSLTLRDLDADQKEEALVRLSWNTHPVCPCGQDGHGLDQIVDLDTLRAELALDTAFTPGCQSDSYERSRVARDLNGDGKPDFLVREVARVMSEDGEGEPRTTRSESRLLYDAATDAWVAAPSP